MTWPSWPAPKEPEPEAEPKSFASSELDERLLQPVNSDLRRSITLTRVQCAYCDRKDGLLASAAERAGPHYPYHCTEAVTSAPSYLLCPGTRTRVRTSGLCQLPELLKRNTHRTTQVLMRVDALFFSTGPFEPLFCSATLYSTVHLAVVFIP